MDFNMEKLDGLIGDVAKGIAERAESAPSPAMAAQHRKIAQLVSNQARDEMVSAARNASFARVASWMFFLPISRRQREIMGRIYSFQCSKNKDGSPSEYRMSLAHGAKELNHDRDNFKNDLRRLVKAGYVAKKSNGRVKPATYLVDEVACITEARENGWHG